MSNISNTEIKLTPREGAVYGYLIAGMSNKEIANAMGLQLVTVKLHVRNVCRKYGVEGRNKFYAKEIARMRGRRDYTGLIDTQGREIKKGCVVHWDDGGAHLPLSERIATRWDRIAEVDMRPDIRFKVIDSPCAKIRDAGYAFDYGSFIYKDTQNHLTIVADSVADYLQKFTDAGQCMAYVAGLRAGKVAA